MLPLSYIIATINLYNFKNRVQRLSFEYKSSDHRRELRRKTHPINESLLLSLPQLHVGKITQKE